MHQPARRIINVDEQRALRPARLKPPMARAVDLNQFANAIPTMPRLMYSPHPLATILPQPGRHHPLPDRLTAKLNTMQLRKLLARKRWAKVRISLANDADHFRSQNRRVSPVAWLATSARHQRSDAASPKRLGQPKHLATANSHQRRPPQKP